MDFLKALGIKKQNSGTSTGMSWDPVQSQTKVVVTSPVDGKIIGSVLPTSPAAYENVIKEAQGIHFDIGS